MTDKTLSVPVELLNNLLALIDHNIGFESHPANELRALLAAPVADEATRNAEDGSAAQKSYWAGFEDARIPQAGWNIREAWNNFKASKSFPGKEPHQLRT